MVLQTTEISTNRGKVGIFDSGFGGLSILKEIVKKMPEYNYLYLGDTLRAPYGSKEHSVILEFTKQGVDFLFSQGAEIIILACNSASAEALSHIQKVYIPKKYPDKKVLGVIIPTAEVAVTKSKNKCIGVLATEATVRAGAFKRELKKLDDTVSVYEVPAPELVPLIENGKESGAEIKNAISKYISIVSKTPIDTLVLGCTHYGIVEDLISSASKGVKIISQAGIVAEKLFLYLEKHQEIKEKLLSDSIVTFFTTDKTKRFETFGSRFFGSTIVAHEVNL